MPRRPKRHSETGGSSGVFVHCSGKVAEILSLANVAQNDHELLVSCRHHLARGLPYALRVDLRAWIQEGWGLGHITCVLPK